MMTHLVRLAALGALLARPVPAAALVGPSSDGAALASIVVMVLHRAGSEAGFCSGIVVARDVVLTAAHCAPRGADLRVHFKDERGGTVLLPVRALVRHPGYKADAVRKRERSIDLALVHTAEPLPDRFRPATLASAPLSDVLLWAKDPRGTGAGACEGDSGGPVLAAADDTVAALTLWASGDGRNTCGALTQALWLAPEKAWIDGVIAGWRADPARP